MLFPKPPPIREGHQLGHYYSAVPNFQDIRSRAHRIFRQDVDLGPSLDLNVSHQLAFLSNFVPFYHEFDWTEQPTPHYRFYLKNDYFTHSSAITLYCFMRHLKPARIVEVGSGFSSALMLDIRDRFHEQTQFTFIDPFPERLLSLLRKDDNYKLLHQVVQDVPLSIFQDLQVNDILFIDSSHVSKIDSDVNFLMFEVLPLLRSGVYIHFHDIFWPFEYPKEWVIERRWAWNEAYLLRAFLQFNSQFEIVLFSSFAVYKFEDFIRKNMPLCLEDGGSLWLRRK